MYLCNIIMAELKFKECIVMLYEPILDAEQTKMKNLSKTIVYAGFGMYLVCYSVYAVYRHENIKTILAAAVIGVLLVFASNFSKRVFPAEAGIVQSVRSWSGRKDTLMPWEDLFLVSFVTEKEQLTVYFDNGKQVWKIEYPSWQRQDIKKLVKKYCPGMEINEITK